MKKLPNFYNNLNLIMSEYYELLEKGVKDRKSAFHNAVFASVNKLNHPDARTVILRGFDKKKLTVSFHSDARTNKIFQIQNNPNGVMVFYDDKKKIQLRITGIAEIKNSYSKAWNKLSDWSKRCYLSEEKPGLTKNKPTSGFPEKFSKNAPNNQESKVGKKNFSCIVIHIDKFEWLYLASQGHRRALFKVFRKNSKIQTSSQWLVP